MCWAQPVDYSGPGIRVAGAHNETSLAAKLYRSIWHGRSLSLSHYPSCHLRRLGSWCTNVLTPTGLRVVALHSHLSALDSALLTVSALLQCVFITSIITTPNVHHCLAFTFYATPHSKSTLFWPSMHLTFVLSTLFFCILYLALTLASSAPHLSSTSICPIIAISVRRREVVDRADFPARAWWNQLLNYWE